MILIDPNTLWSCDNCFHNKNGECSTFCDVGEAYRPDSSKLKYIDAVPVVRCKDCTYCEKQLNHLYCGTLNAVVTEDWYCADGKMREEKQK